MDHITGIQVHQTCQWLELAEALSQAHCGPIPQTGRSLLDAPGPPAQSFYNLPAFMPGVAFGIKMVTIVPGNPALTPPLPAVQALYALFDGQAGSPLCTINGTAMTYRKTAADSALGSRFLSRPGSSTLLMAGAGGLAPYLIDAHRAVRPSIRHVLVWNRDAKKAQILAKACGGAAITDLDAAVPEADIISCATSSATPLIRGKLLKAGCHLDLVGAYTPEMRECDDDAVTRARLFVDSRQFAIDQPGDLANPIARGVISAKDVEADLFDLCQKGFAADRKDDDITLFKNGGGAHLDLFTALFIWNTLNPA